MLRCRRRSSAKATTSLTARPIQVWREPTRLLGQVSVPAPPGVLTPVKKALHLSVWWHPGSERTVSTRAPLRDQQADARTRRGFSAYGRGRVRRRVDPWAFGPWAIRPSSSRSWSQESRISAPCGWATRAFAPSSVHVLCHWWTAWRGRPACGRSRLGSADQSRTGRRRASCSRGVLRGFLEVTMFYGTTGIRFRQAPRQRSVTRFPERSGFRHGRFQRGQHR